MEIWENYPLIEPHHEKTRFFCHMQTTKAQISLSIRTVWSAPLLYNTYTCYIQNFKTLASFWCRALTWSQTPKTGFLVTRLNYHQIPTIWAASWQNQQNGMCAQRRQISLGIRPVWSESSLSAWRNLGSLAIHWGDSKDSDQAGRMPRLIWVFAGCTCDFVGFIVLLLTSVSLNICFRHPVAVFFHLLFKVGTILLYLLCGWFSDSFITNFVLIVILLSMDFWTVKNISGKRTVKIGKSWTPKKLL